MNKEHWVYLSIVVLVLLVAWFFIFIAPDDIDDITDGDFQEAVKDSIYEDESFYNEKIDEWSQSESGVISS